MKWYKIVRRVCCRSSSRTLLLPLRQQLFPFQQVPVGSASRLRGGNQAKKASCFKVSVLGSQVGSAKTDSFFVSSAHGHIRCCGRYRYDASWCSGGVCSWNGEPDDVKIDEGTTLPARCRVSGFAGVQSSLRCWPENDLQFSCSDFEGTQNRVETRSSPSLCRWLVTDEQFHVSVSKGVLHGRRRRVARTISSSRCSSSAQGGRFSACSTRFLGSTEAGSGLVPSSHSFCRV